MGIFGFHKMRGISWLAAKTGQLLKRDCAPWSKYVCMCVYVCVYICVCVCVCIYILYIYIYI
jgi:hypothetical protein